MSRVLRHAIVRALLEPVPRTAGLLLRTALNEDRGDKHPEDECEICQEPFEPWFAPTPEWAARTGLGYGGPILCRPCFDELPDRRRCNCGAVPAAGEPLAEGVVDREDRVLEWICSSCSELNHAT